MNFNFDEQKSPEPSYCKNIFEKSKKEGKFAYLSCKKHNPYETLCVNKIQAIKLKYSIDPIKHNKVGVSPIESPGCIVTNKKPDVFYGLYQGKQVTLSAGPRDGIKMTLRIVHESSGKMKELGPDQIDKFVYGGFCSRFWLMKHHANVIEDQAKIPKCWEMISIKYQHDFSEHQLDLIIPDEEQMEILIQYLLEITFYNKLYYMKQRFKTLISEAELPYEIKENAFTSLDQKLERKKIKNRPNFSDGLKVYRFMRMRMKISYMAYQKKMSINRMFLQTILNSYYTLREVKTAGLDTILAHKTVKGMFAEVLNPSTQGSTAAQEDEIQIVLSQNILKLFPGYNKKSAYNNPEYKKLNQNYCKVGLLL